MGPLVPLLVVVFPILSMLAWLLRETAFFAYSQACMQAQVHALLNDTKAIKTWVAPFPYAAILVSDLNAQDLGAILHRCLSDSWFIVTEMNRQTVDGWLPGNLWEYVNEPEQAWSRKLFEQLPSPQTRPPDNPFAALLSKGREM